MVASILLGEIASYSWFTYHLRFLPYVFTLNLQAFECNIMYGCSANFRSFGRLIGSGTNTGEQTYLVLVGIKCAFTLNYESDYTLDRNCFSFPSIIFDWRKNMIRAGDVWSNQNKFIRIWIKSFPFIFTRTPILKKSIALTCWRS